MLKFEAFTKKTNRAKRFNWDLNNDLNHIKPPKRKVKKKEVRPVIKNRIRINPPLNEKAGISPRDQFADHHTTLDSLHKDAIARYKGESDFELANTPLRGMKGESVNSTASTYKQGEYSSDYSIPEHKHLVKKLDKITSGQVKHPIVVYRGAHVEGTPLAKKGQASSDMEAIDRLRTMKPGTQFKDHGFTSTTMNKGIASGFTKVAREHFYDDKQNHISSHEHHTVFAIHLHPGVKAHYLDMDRDHENQDEKEVLLHRGTTYEVVKHVHKVKKKMLPIYTPENKPPLKEKWFFHTHTVHLKVADQDDHTKDIDQTPNKPYKYSPGEDHDYV